MPAPDPSQPSAGPPKPDQPPQAGMTPRVLRLAYFTAGLMLIGLGLIGAVLPVMPTTVFLILAAACFARSSPRLEAWILNHPQFGPGVAAWRAHGAIPRPAKIVAISAMALSFAIMVLLRSSATTLLIAGPVLIASALFVGTRPSGPRGG